MGIIDDFKWNREWTIANLEEEIEHRIIRLSHYM